MANFIVTGKWNAFNKMALGPYSLCQVEFIFHLASNFALEDDYTPFIAEKEMVKNVCLGFLSITSNSFPIMINDWNC